MENRRHIDLKTPSGASAIYNNDLTSLNQSDEEIRVIHLASGSDGSFIECTLHKISLKSNPAPKYDALSYTWGDATDTREIILNGYVVNVTHNLFLALRRLRQKEEERVIWVDAVCINQLDLDERAQQVDLMRKVYSLCTQAVIWLGEPPEQATPTFPMHWFGDERDDDSLEWLWNNFYDYATDPEFDTTDGDTVDWVFHGLANIRLLLTGHLSDQPLFADFTGDSFSYPTGYSRYCRSLSKALRPFYKNPWWTRVWTVQESVLPPKACVHYGPTTLDFLFLLDAFATLAKHVLDDCCSKFFSSSDLNIRSALGRIGSKIVNIRNLRNNQRDGSVMGLWETLIACHAREATDDRDKIFGVLGLVNSWPVEPISADYKATVEALYRQVTASQILENSSLVPLHLPLRKYAHQNLPSWTVDWTAPHGYGSQLNTYQFGRDIYKSFEAGGKQPCRPVFSSDQQVLQVNGRRCDRVSSVGRMVPAGSPAKKRKAYCDWFRMAQIHRCPSKSYVSGCSYFQAFWRCLSWNILMIMSEDPCTKESMRQFDAKASDEEYYEAFLSYSKTSRSSIFHPKGLSKEDRKAVLKFDPTFAPADDQAWGQFSSLAFRAEQVIHGLTVNMVMFMTDSGYIGIGPPQTKVGDEVWCLFGGSIPFVVRSTGKTCAVRKGETETSLWEVLGNCYVHGIMNGEIADDENLPAQTICLG
ncbi:unnamed protein product [Clonostachys byssicola]|uniref:Heterokaryon incompatibility domain-containing protein n=1 Tax=Clonostachys byssicola TaxID=160290 RepID=A0A9N9Y2T5_9HYPO|nr:unnamed protein product [Clonostachys byssicola]